MTRRVGLIPGGMTSPPANPFVCHASTVWKTKSEPDEFSVSNFEILELTAELANANDPKVNP